MCATQQAGDRYPGFLQEKEEVLWSERRHKLCDALTWLLIGCNIPLLLIYGLLLLNCTEPGGMLPEESKYLLLFPAMSALCLLLVIYCMLSNSRTVYILTRKHAHLVINYPLYGRKTYTTRITRHMEFEVKRHKDGSADYMLMQQRIGKLTIPTGFIGVRKVAEFEHQLKLCGVQISDSAHATPTPPPSRKKLVILTLIPFLILGVTIHRIQSSDELWLAVMGQPATATVVGYKVHTKMEGSKVRKAVTRYYPVLRFRTTEDTLVQAVDRLGDKRPRHELYSRVDIIYLTHKPDVAERATFRRYVKPALILFFFLASLIALGVHLHRWHCSRRQAEGCGGED